MKPVMAELDPAIPTRTGLANNAFAVSNNPIGMAVSSRARVAGPTW
jgi:hypothetical protein